MRARVVSLRKRCQQRMGELGSVQLSISETPSRCPRCGGSMKVQKTAPRSGQTLSHGEFDARETIHVCRNSCRWPSGVLVTRRAVCLSARLPPGSNVGYDVMVFVGIERFLQSRQRDKIRAELLDQGVSVSTGEVSKLAAKFVTYLARLHQARADKIRAVLQQDGGWPLHIDATGESGRGTVLAAIAGWRNWVLGAWKIATERADLILPCLRQTVRLFGSPCAAMRDLGKAMTPALDALVAELDLNIPVLACHQHFLADVGKDLLEPAHAELRASFRRSKLCPKLRALVRDLGRELGTHIEDARAAVLEWQTHAEADHRIASGREGLATVRALAQWVLDFKAQATGLDFPFDRPYLDLYERCIKASRAADAFLRTAPKDKAVTRALERLHRYVHLVVSAEVPFQQITRRLRHRADLFDELRSVLRIVAAPAVEETDAELSKMQEQLDALVSSLNERRPSRGPAQDTRNAIQIILDHIDTHGDNLWGHAIALPESAGGGSRLVARTNYVSENFFGKVKHDERIRSGYKNLGYVLETMPAEALLVRNLEHDDYVATVCGSLDLLPQAFAQLDCEDRERKLNNLEPLEDDELDTVLQVASASLSPADRRVIRTKAMDRRIASAAASRAPRIHP